MKTARWRWPGVLLCSRRWWPLQNAILTVYSKETVSSRRMAQGKIGRSRGVKRAGRERHPSLLIMVVGWKKVQHLCSSHSSFAALPQSALRRFREPRRLFFVGRKPVRGNPLLSKIMSKHGDHFEGQRKAWKRKRSLPPILLIETRSSQLEALSTF